MGSNAFTSEWTSVSVEVSFMVLNVCDSIRDASESAWPESVRYRFSSTHRREFGMHALSVNLISRHGLTLLPGSPSTERLMLVAEYSLKFYLIS